MRCVWVKAYERAGHLPLLPTAWREGLNHMRPPVDNRLQGSSSWQNLATGRDRKVPGGLERRRARMSSRLRSCARSAPGRSSPPSCRRSTSAASTRCARRSRRCATTSMRSTRPTTPPRTRTPRTSRSRSRWSDWASSPCCRSSAVTRTGSALQADIVGAALHGVENICCLTGDDVTAGDEPEARRVFDLDGPSWSRIAERMRSGSTCRAADSIPPPTSSSAPSRTRRPTARPPARAGGQEGRRRRALPAAADLYRPERLEASWPAPARSA